MAHLATRGKKAQRGMLNVLHSTKWTISGRSRVMPSQERVFAEQFSDYVGRGHGVPCASGTAALTIALQALDVGFGDEVIVPALTWVARIAEMPKNRLHELLPWE